MNMKDADRKASVLEKELEQQRVDAELARWSKDIDDAWRAFSGA